jgi:hypothetical protein
MADQSTMVVACWRRITPRVARVRQSAGRTGRRTRPSTGDRSTAPMRRPTFFLLRTSATLALFQITYSVRVFYLRAQVGAVIGNAGHSRHSLPVAPTTRMSAACSKQIIPRHYGYILLDSLVWVPFSKASRSDERVPKRTLWIAVLARRTSYLGRTAKYAKIRLTRARQAATDR